MGKSYAGKFVNMANLAINAELGVNILFRVQIKSHMIHFQIQKVAEMRRISRQRNIHVFLQHQGNI